MGATGRTLVSTSGKTGVAAVKQHEHPTVRPSLVCLFREDTVLMVEIRLEE